MNPTHTPGPWKVSHGANRYPSVGSAMTHTKICDLPSDMTGIPDCDNEIKANAALIAAAPDMLKALKDSVMLLEMFGRVLERDIKAGDNIDAEIYQRIVNAIKLAKGEPQP